jgi:imidazolonepropionase-like amidohydrolase
VVVTSDFLFTDRGNPVPLKSTYTATPSLEPISLVLAGKSSRLSDLNDTLQLDAVSKQITLLRGGKTTTFPASATSFLIDGYSPVMQQEMLMRWWLAHGRPAQIAAPPGGSVHVQPADDLVFTTNGSTHNLHSYVLTGLIWGGETLWLDDAQQLIALVSTDAEFDHFEAVRDGYEASLPAFIQAAAKNSLAALAKLSAAAKQPAAKRLAITNVTLIDGTGAPAAPHSTVVMEDGRITAVYRGAMPKLRDTTVLSGEGKFLIPGLWDMHAHYEQVEWGPIYLAAGVTTVRDCGNEFDFITTVRDVLASGKGIGPRLLIAGIVDGAGPVSVGAITADTPEEAIAVVRRYKAAGALQIKIYSSMKPALVPVIAAETHRLGMTLTGHVPNGMTTVQAIEAGYDAINHISFLENDLLGPPDRTKPVPAIDLTTPVAQHLFDVIVQHRTVIDDTISLSELTVRPLGVSAESLEPGLAHVAPQLAAALDFPALSPERAERYARVFPNATAVLHKLHELDVPIVAGTDQNIPGYSLHRELEIYVEHGGFTPMQALQAATMVPARAMKMDAELGTIEKGKRADMVLLDADPLLDIHNTRRIASTISGGAVYSPAPLWQSVDFKP